MKENLLLADSAMAVKEFVSVFRVCWKVMKLYGRKEQEFDSFCKTYIEVLGDLRASRVVRALKDCLKTSKELPTPSEIREKALGLDYDLTEKEKKHRIMHSRAVERSFGEHMLSTTQNKELALYEKENGLIDVKIDWVEDYDLKFQGIVNV